MPELDIENLSKLCRIKLSDKELEEIEHDLSRFLDYMKQLEEVDVSDLSPYGHVDEQGVDSLRADVVGDELPRETFLKNAPDKVGGMIRVPPIIKS